MEPTNLNANTYVNPLCIERDTAGQFFSRSGTVLDIMRCGLHHQAPSQS